VNGWIITRLNINSFITTLSTLFIYTAWCLDYRGLPRLRKSEKFHGRGRGEFLYLSTLFWIAVATLALIYGCSRTPSWAAT